MPSAVQLAEFLMPWVCIPDFPLTSLPLDPFVHRFAIHLDFMLPFKRLKQWIYLQIITRIFEIWLDQSALHSARNLLILRPFPSSHRCLGTLSAVIRFILCNSSVAFSQHQVVFGFNRIPPPPSTWSILAFSPLFFLLSNYFRRQILFALSLIITLNLGLIQACHLFSCGFTIHTLAYAAENFGYFSTPATGAML